MRTTTWSVALVLVALSAGCGREHLSPAFGRANREAFRSQAARPPDRVPPPPSTRLDAQEAEVIGGAYVRSLGGKQDRVEPRPVLMIEPQQNGGGPQRLAPSVPKD